MFSQVLGNEWLLLYIKTLRSQYKPPLKKHASRFLPPEKRRTLRIRSLAVGFALVTGLWAVLYLPHLRTSPSWYGDEILTLDIGKALSHGELANRAVFCTFNSPNYNYQPGFAWCVGWFSRMNQGDILGGRVLSTLIGGATALVGFWFFSRKFGIATGLFFSFLLLGYSQAIVHYRWIYPQNVIGLSLIGAAGLLLRPARASQDWKIGGFLALGAASHLLAFHATVVSGLCRLVRPKSWIPIGFPPLLVFGGTFALLSLRFPGWVTEDFRALLEQYGRYNEENGSGAKVLINVFYFFTQDTFHLLAAGGCLLVLSRRAYPLGILSLGMVFLLTRNRQNLTLFYYQAMSVLPLLAATISVGYRHGCGFLIRKWSLLRSHRHRLRWLFPGLALATALFQIPGVLHGRLPVRITPWVVSSIADYESAARWLNQNTKPEDLVITYWNLGWLLQAKNADILTAAAWAGYPAGDYFPTPPRHERFRYPADLRQAKFFAITELDTNWAFGQGHVLAFLKDSRVETWPLIYQAGPIKILANPDWSPR
jgi:hypothetical protein